MRFRLGLIISLTALLLPAATFGSAGPAIGFSQPSYVDQHLAGGEPLLFEDTIHHTLVYTSHEGTTHLYRPGFMSPTGDQDFFGDYRNQIELWISKDDGTTWNRIDSGGGFRTNPAYTGFSDPDLTQDTSGRLYDTGIDLANDALFSSNDGGATWNEGTPQCNDGDRPWLAGGNKDEVFMATDTVEDGQSDPTGTGHSLYVSKDGGQTCSRVATDYGDTTAGGATAYVGFGKLYMDHARQRLIEPEVYQKPDDQGNLHTIGIGVGTWKRGDTKFTPHFIANTTLQGHFPSIALDTNDDVYLVWDTDPRGPADSTGGCGQGPTPLANQIMFTMSKDWGQTWSKPVAVADPGNTRVLWPWAVAGDPGKVSVVWYQSDKVNDPDCAADDVQWSIYEAQLNGAGGPHQTQTTIQASPVIHKGGICQGGTTCVATGQDRRLGDFFTNAIDARGCVIIASGDTRMTDSMGGQLPTARPIFIRQTAGPALLGNGSCGGPNTGDQSYVKGERKAHRHKKAHCSRAHRRGRKHRHSTCAKKKHHKKHYKH